MITPGLAAGLDLLTQALDLPGTDVAETMRRLAVDARTAVASYLGLSVAITAEQSPFEQSPFDLTVLDDGAGPGDIHTSLLVPLATTPGAGSTGTTPVALILYAATPGAFVDLAADLAWVTGRPLTEFRLDGHLTLPSSHTEPPRCGPCRSSIRRSAS